MTTDGELYSWGLNFKGQLGVGDFENRAQPVLVDSFTGAQSPNLLGQSQQSASQTKKYLVQMLKRSKSKEAGGSAQIVGGSQTQRINPANGDTASFGANIPGNHGQRNNFPVANNSASKSIFNASFKELKPSKSVDLT